MGRRKPRSRWILLGLLGILSWMLLSGCLARALVYPVPRVPVGAPPLPLVEEILGRSLVAWSWSPAAARPEAPVLLFFHGNGENLQTLRDAGTLDRLREIGLPFLAIDYPGYGRSGGKPSEARLLDAADAAVAWAGARHPGRRVIPFGWSLGAAVAVQTAARHPDRVEGMILASPWTSLPEVARGHFPGWLVWLLLRDRYESLEAAGSVRCPALILHGAEDDLIPAGMGRRMAGALKGSRRVEVPGAGHNDLLGKQEVWETAREFVLSRKPP